jgi:membrane protein implicated in regulation of membrane protease activity
VLADRQRIIADLTHYWREAGLRPRVIDEMRSELEQHLIDAEANGEAPEMVVSDLAELAQEWAAARAGRRVAPWEDVQSGRTRKEREARRDARLYGFAAIALVSAAAVAGQGGSSLDSETWRWLWTIFAIAMGIGEIFTAGFFLLPFAIGAAAAAILAWLNITVVAQWLVFFGVSAFSFAYLRKYIGRQDEGEQPRVGANRWTGAEGVVLEPIDPSTGSGMVRILNEEWRATAFARIEAGTRIMVTQVQGTRLVVEPIEN